jgi:hypothetical protein
MVGVIKRHDITELPADRQGSPENKFCELIRLGYFSATLLPPILYDLSI